MPITVELDDLLLQQAIAATGAATAKDAVELALKTLIGLKAQAGIRDLFGTIQWEGDLELSRLNRIR